MAADQAAASVQGAAPYPVTCRSHPVRQYVMRVASIDEEKYPEWNTKRAIPKLPVPLLNDTLEKYLQAIRPVVSPDQYVVTSRLCAEFLKKGGEGEALQKSLSEFSGTKDNWVTDFWLDDMYMKARLALPINSNVGMVFPRQRFPDKDSQLRYSARLISGILDYKSIIDTRSLPVDRARSREKGQPLCMAQYYRLFSSYRVPGVGKDHLVISTTTKSANDPMMTPENDHIIVACNNQFFSMDVVANYTRLSDDDLYTQLKRIVKMAEEGLRDGTNERVGILTASARDSWARSREKLMEIDPVNRASLDLIEKCIFVLNLDNAIPLSFNHQKSVDETEQNRRDDVSLAQQMLHGFGPSVNACNRWFDKTMQFVICADGACGLNYEHSPSEGIAVVQLIEHLLKYMEEVRKRKLPRMQSLCELAYPKKLRWKITADISCDIEKSSSCLSTLISTLDLYVLRFTEFGREFPKKHNMSPDAFIQLAIQLTYYKVHGHLVSTYESASIRRFRLGRVDNIRACTNQALEWCRAVIGETDATDEEKMDLFRKAIKQQTDILVQTILGYGIDNHLLGLRQMADRNGRKTPAIFEDASYQISNHFTLSTSQVPTTMDAFMCYGPVVPDGYGVCYNPHPEYILCAITSFNTCGETRSDFFAFTLESSFMQMREICLRAAQMAADKAAGVNGISNGQGERTTAKVRNSPARTKLRRQKPGGSSSEEEMNGK